MMDRNTADYTGEYTASWCVHRGLLRQWRWCNPPSRWSHFLYSRIWELNPRLVPIMALWEMCCGPAVRGWTVSMWQPSLEYLLALGFYFPSTYPVRGRLFSYWDLLISTETQNCVCIRPTSGVAYPACIRGGYTPAMVPGCDAPSAI